MLKQYFEGKTLREISAQLVEEFKNNRLNTLTKKNTPRGPATVNSELTLLSSAYSLAVKYDEAESNPCSRLEPGWLKPDVMRSQSRSCLDTQMCESRCVMCVRLRPVKEWQLRP